MNIKQLNEKEFFEHLLEETELAFDNSPVKQRQERLGKKWNYSICANPIRRGKGIIFGLNWGADGTHHPQSIYPSEHENLNWNFINRSKKYFEKYLDFTDLNEVNYSNMCFFRSPKISDLVTEDWERSLPLFRSYVEYIDPEWMLMLGSSGLGQLKRFGQAIELRSVVSKGSGSRNTYAYEFELFGKNKVFVVPHPNAMVNGQARDDVWEELFNKKRRS